MFSCLDWFATCLFMNIFSERDHTILLVCYLLFNDLFFLRYVFSSDDLGSSSQSFLYLSDMPAYEYNSVEGLELHL